MNILALYQSQSGCCYHRIYNVLRYFPMQNGDKIRRVSEKETLYEADFADVDIVFFNRLPHFISNEKLFELRAKHGFKVVVDIDDYWILYYHHILYKSFKEHRVPERIQECLQEADLVTTTNDQLWQRVKAEANMEVHVLPNALPIGLEQFDYKPQQHEKTNVIYTGGSSHLNDLRSIDGMFKRLGSDGEWVKKGNFIFAGYNNVENSQTSVYWKMFGIVRHIKNFSLDLPLPVSKYMSFYNRADLSIAPLEHNVFNNCKSNLKTIEAGCKKIPILASDGLPYSIDKGVQGVTLCHNSADFYNEVKFYLRNPLKCQEDGLALHEYVKENYNYEKINNMRYQLFNSLL